MGNRQYKLITRYGITEGDYDNMLLTQGNRCAICGVIPSPFKFRGRLFVDHDYQGARGLLCNNCNLGIGHLQHKPYLLREAAMYLERTA